MLLTITQGVLVLLFAMAGIMKMMMPKAKFDQKMAWAKEYSEKELKKIGALELLGALGLVLPVWLGIAEWLTPLAALGLALTALMAVKLHMKRKETGNMAFAGAIALLALYVLWQNWALLGF